MSGAGLDGIVSGSPDGLSPHGIAAIAAFRKHFGRALADLQVRRAARAARVGLRGTVALSAHAAMALDWITCFPLCKSLSCAWSVSRACCANMSGASYARGTPTRLH